MLKSSSEIIQFFSFHYYFLSFSSSHFLLLSCTHQDASGNLTTFSLTSQADWASPAERIRQADGSTRRGKLFKHPPAKSADGSGTDHAGNQFYMYIFFHHLQSVVLCCAPLFITRQRDSITPR